MILLLHVPSNVRRLVKYIRTDPREEYCSAISLYRKPSYRIFISYLQNRIITAAHDCTVFIIYVKHSMTGGMELNYNRTTVKLYK